jgi:predicted nucleic-acid-binding protein
VEAGLAQLEAGGDFADAVIANEGQWLGGHIFMSFDRQAVALLQMRGVAAELLR